MWKGWKMLLELIDEELTKEEAHERKGFYASELCGCDRAIWYDIKKYPVTNPIEAKSYGVMKIGVYLEQMLLDLLEKNDKIEKIERQVKMRVPFEGVDLPLSMSWDAKVFWKSGAISGNEIKTGYGFGSDLIIKKNEVKEEWVYQIASYLNYGGLNEYNQIYMDRGHGMLVEFIYTYVDGKLKCTKYIRGGGTMDVPVPNITKDTIKDRVQKLHNNLQSEEPPKHPYTREKNKKGEWSYSTWRCGKYCKYRDLCWKDNNDM